MSTTIDVTTKDAFEQIRGKWGVEWAEMETLRRAADASSIKAFLTSATDSYIPKYVRNRIDVPRQSVFVGTTNDMAFLTDMTGNRRFWPIQVGRINIARLLEIRDAIWGAVVARTLASNPETHYFESCLEVELAARNESLRAPDPWEERIESWLISTAEYLSTANILLHAVGREPQHWNRADENRIGKIMRSFGYEKGSRPHGQPRQWIKSTQLLLESPATT
jgi:putative DNA primase/helicase